ncbi:hypothetical protein RI065_08165 [Mycoplasmatota bacterium zrk1]
MSEKVNEIKDKEIKQVEVKDDIKSLKEYTEKELASLPRFDVKLEQGQNLFGQFVKVTIQLFQKGTENCLINVQNKHFNVWM